MNSEFQQFLPIFMLIVVAAGFAASAIAAPMIIGKRRSYNKVKDSAYECGLPSDKSSGVRFSVKFYMVAMLFVIFDIEVVFMYPWAVQFRDLVAQGPAALVSMAGFAGILVIAYAYALKKGALNWKS